MRLLSTKILDPALKQRILSLGYSLIEYAFIQIIERKTPPIEILGEALIFSSQNALKIGLKNPHLNPQIKSRACYCVGPKTKALLEANQIQVLGYAPTAGDLVQSLIDSQKTFSFFCGTKRLNTIETALKKANRLCQIVELYDTLLTPYQIEKPADGLLFFSPSAVESYFSLPQKISGPAFCLGSTTFDCYQKFGDQGIQAIEPHASGLLATIQKYFQKK